MDSVTPKYKSTLDQLMTFLHRDGAMDGAVGGRYTRNRQYTVDELIAITPEDIVRWMTWKAYGENPAPGAGPTFARSNSLAFYKKAISHFMPNINLNWNSVTKDGNPTKSPPVNKFIAKVKKAEARNEGAESQVRRSMSESEFLLLHDLLKLGNPSNQLLWRFGIPALINYQFHMMARIDDVTQVVLRHIRVHDHFSDALKTRLNWSKNVLDERDAPWQVMLGSLNHKCCVYISLGLWLELSIRQNVQAMISPYLFAFSPDCSVPRGGQRAKDMVQTIYRQRVFMRPEFLLLDEDTGRVGPLGSHSIRKFSSTHMRRCGCSKDEKDIRGRWKGKGRTSDVYDDVELPYPDAKVAEKLSLGGPCFYVYDVEVCGNDAAMMNQFVLSHVVPHVRRRIPQGASLVLGKAVLWCIFCPDSHYFAIPQDYAEQVRMEWKHVRGENWRDDQNPIKRVPITVNGNQGSVFIDELPDVVLDENGNVIGGGDVRGNGIEAIRNQLLAIQAAMMSLRRENNELRNEIGHNRLAMQRGLEIVNGNIKRIAIVPAHRRARVMGGGEVAPDLFAANAGGGNGEPGTGGVGAADNGLAMMATLMATPRSLHDLWSEYQHGVGGRKAAKLFTAAERGRVKYKFTRRKVIWDIVSNLVRAGHTSDTAIDRLYTVYGGQRSTTEIINLVRRDKKLGTLNPNLRV
jgi:hypothetical protein